MTTTTPRIVLGTSSVGDAKIQPMARFETHDQVKALLHAFAARGYDHLDTSRMYHPSEVLLGAAAAGERFTIDTKVTSMIPAAHTRERVCQEIDASRESLKIHTINTEYLHVPDRETDPLEACEAMDRAIRDGKIRQWGLSNYTAEEVARFLDLCEQHGLVKPRVYQGQYNAVVRSGEEALFPLLRKHGMAFYAFSPAAGGLFAGNHRKVQPGARFDPSHGPGARYSGIYLKPCIIAAAEKATQIAAKHGINGHAASLRWTTCHSALSRAHDDAVLIGVSTIQQLHSNLGAVEAGPLPDEVAAAFDEVYKASVEGDVAIAYHL